MERQTTNMREAIPVNKRVAVALYKLCSSAEDRTIANLFDMGRSMVNIIYREFCEAVVDSLEERWVGMPTPSEMEDHIKDFQLSLGFPQGVGALDGCHFPVSPPKENASDYYNYKGWYSVILLALVDHNYMFRFINVGSPGRCHDAHVYHQSSLSRLIEGPTFRKPKTTLGNVAVPPLTLPLRSSADGPSDGADDVLGMPISAALCTCVWRNAAARRLKNGVPGMAAS
ncbi:hypothetical protein MTO96_049247 [Rhipicephalus appendiculatus]